MQTGFPGLSFAAQMNRLRPTRMRENHTHQRARRRYGGALRSRTAPMRRSARIASDDLDPFWGRLLPPALGADCPVTDSNVTPNSRKNVVRAVSLRPLQARICDYILDKQNSDQMRGASMYRLMTFVALTFVLLVGASPAWAGPIEDVKELADKQGQAFDDGNPDGYVADFADNAVFTPSLATFRIEGKQEIRGYFARLFQIYPQRQSIGRQPMRRVYANNTVVVVDDYADQTWVDKNGHATLRSVRTTSVWVKIDGRWLTVDEHVSVVPELP